MKQSIVVPRATSVPKLIKSEESFEKFIYDPVQAEEHMVQVTEYDMIMRKLKEEKLAYYASKQQSSIKFDLPQKDESMPPPREKKRGPLLDKTVRLKVCDMGNGCWTHHHFTSKIQTRQY